MARRRPPRKKFPLKRLTHQARHQEPSFFLLERFSLEDISRWTALRDKILRYHWEYYSSLAYQRSRLTDDIRAALLDASEKPFPFARWQRVVKYKYALEPLSVAGSLADIGGRFNIGDIDPARFPPFPALYLASDSPTALQETLGQDNHQELNSLELALSKPASIANVSVSGSLDAVINLNAPEKLKRFVELIKDFVVPGHLARTTQEAKWEPPELIRTVAQLLNAFLYPDWRQWANLYDVPVASQIFGQLVVDAGIEGILYPSKFSGKDCLAVFPQNFENDSFVALDDEPPPGARLRRLDAKTWKEIGRGP
jgi:hypothetical protein